MRTGAALVICGLVCALVIGADPAANTAPSSPPFDGKSLAGGQGNLQALQVRGGAIVGGQLDKPQAYIPEPQPAPTKILIGVHHCPLWERDYQTLLRKAKNLVESFPASELGSKMLLLDNWNEWSEGHYIAPHREFGFGYLDAVRAVFSNAPKEHTDLLPEQIGMGPYDRAYKRHLEAGYRPGATK